MNKVLTYVNPQKKWTPETLKKIIDQLPKERAELIIIAPVPENILPKLENLKFACPFSNYFLNKET